MLLSPSAAAAGDNSDDDDDDDDDGDDDDGDDDDDHDEDEDDEDKDGNCVDVLVCWMLSGASLRLNDATLLVQNRNPEVPGGHCRTGVSGRLRAPPL